MTHTWCNVSVVDSSGQTLAQLSTFFGNIRSGPSLANQTLPNDGPLASSEKSSKSVANAISSPKWVQDRPVNQAHEVPLIISDERPMKREEFERMRPFLRMGLGPTDILELYHIISLVADAATAHKVFTKPIYLYYDYKCTGVRVLGCIASKFVKGPKSQFVQIQSSRTRRSIHKQLMTLKLKKEGSYHKNWGHNNRNSIKHHCPLLISLRKFKNLWGRAKASVLQPPMEPLSLKASPAPAD